MKLTTTLAMFSLLGTAVITAPAQAHDASTAVANPVSEFSSVAAKKKKKRVIVAAPAAHGTYGWRGSDPSFDRYGRPYRPPEYLAGCAMDLGYGRWASCNINE